MIKTKMFIFVVLINDEKMILNVKNAFCRKKTFLNT